MINITHDIETRLLAGETPVSIAEDLGLDTRETDDGTVVLLPGWVADDGNAKVEYPYADSGDEAAREYVSDGDWGDTSEGTTWVTVHAWRVGLVCCAPECVWCTSVAVAHDSCGDIACAEHAIGGITDVVCEGPVLEPFTSTVETVEVDRDSYSIAIEPETPECEDGDEHDWRSPHDLVGGIESNPGVWGHGGGVIIEEVCVRCGCGRTTDTWAQDRETGAQGLTSVSYEAGKYDVTEYQLRDLAAGIGSEGVVDGALALAMREVSR